MEVKVVMRDDYRFIVFLDDEAIELLHQICKAREESSTDILETFILGGMALTDLLDKEYEKIKIDRTKSRYVRLLKRLHILRE